MTIAAVAEYVSLSMCVPNLYKVSYDILLNFIKQQKLQHLQNTVIYFILLNLTNKYITQS